MPIEEMDVLTPDDMNEMYDYLVMGNVEKMKYLIQQEN